MIFCILTHGRVELLGYPHSKTKTTLFTLFAPQWNLVTLFALCLLFMLFMQ